MVILPSKQHADASSGLPFVVVKVPHLRSMLYVFKVVVQ